MLEIDYEATAVQLARSFARAPNREEMEMIDNEDDVLNYERRDMNASTTKREQIQGLRSVIIGVTQPSEGDVVISKELAKEVVTALHNAAGFGAYIPRAVSNDRVADYAESVRRESTQALTRFRRAWIAGECGQ